MMADIDFTKLKVCLDEILQTTHTPSVDCLVYQNHTPIFRYYAGLSDVENNIQINGNELYFIFSMTKMLTCTCALQLFEQGKYAMDDFLADYIPAFRQMKITSDALNVESSAKIMTGANFGECEKSTESGYAQNQIRIVDLFTMSAGLDYNLHDEAITNALNEGKTSTKDLVTAMASKTLGFEPGTRFRYSLCHDVLGALIEIWSGKTLGAYMEENIFKPLSMQNTFFRSSQNKDVFERFAARYSVDQDGALQRVSPECVYNLSEEYQSGGAGLVSCTEDYALFLDAIACGGVGKSGNRILKEETINLWKTNHLQGQALEDFHKLRAGYGYGLGVRTHMDPEESGSLSPVGEFGWDGAAGAFAMVDTEHKLSLTYFQHCHKWNVPIQTQMRNALYSCLK